MGITQPWSTSGDGTGQKRRDWSWPFWPLVPLYPYGQRRTLQREVVKDTIWTFEQVQGIFYVTVPIRMTVVRLAMGGLLVYAPIAPTPECVRLVQELETRYGKARFIILPTLSGLEHKVFVGPFARCFATAQVLVAPHQWSYPVNLPLSWLGLPRKRTQVLPTCSAMAPFSAEFDYAMVGPIDLRLGFFGEVAFFHRSSRTLLVTDGVVSIPERPPAIVQLDPYPLLFHARDNSAEPLVDSHHQRQKGWQRITLFAFYFRPSTLRIAPFWESISAAWQAPDRSRRAYFGWYPFQWQDRWHQSFEALRRDGCLFVAPILQTLIFNRGPKEVLDWVNQVTQWSFERIIPCHFDAPIAATPQQFQQAFEFLTPQTQDQSLLVEDAALLRQLETGLLKTILPKRGTISPTKPGSSE